MKSTLILNSLLIAILVLCGCSPEKKITNIADFDLWISNSKNKLTMSRSVNGVTIVVTYLLPEYNALKEMEMKGMKKQSYYDSLLVYYKTTASFIMTIAPDEKKGYKGDIMYKDLNDFKGYVERAMEMNFNLENKVELEAKNIKYVPVLSSLDNTYSLTNDRKINFVFAPISNKDELKNSLEYCFVYHDEIFKMGTLYFCFDKQSIENNLPDIIL